MRTLDHIVKLLDRHHQRATYGAVAELVAGIPRPLMRARPRDPMNSWIVDDATGMPPEYPPDRIHPAIAERSTILSTASELAAWLDRPG